MKDTLKIIGLITLIIGLAGGGCYMGYARYKECHRTHPWWYCVESK